MIPHTTVHSNTEAPYAEWRPAYVIVGVWEGPVLRTPWIPYDLWLIAQPIATKLIEDFFRQGRFGKTTTYLARYRVDICEAIALAVRAGGLQIEILYPPFQEAYGHCRTVTLTRR